MPPTVTIDTDSAPGSYRAALNPDAASCRACGHSVCGCSDAAYQGLLLAPACHETGLDARLCPCTWCARADERRSPSFQHFHSFGS